MISSTLINDQGRVGCYISEAIFTASLIISVGLSFFVKEDLRRQRAEKEKRENKEKSNFRT